MEAARARRVAPRAAADTPALMELWVASWRATYADIDFDARLEWFKAPSRRARGRWRAHALLVRRRAFRSRGLCRDPSRDRLARSTLRASQPLWRGRRAGVDRSGAPSVAERHPARRERRQQPRPTLLRARRLLPRWRGSRQPLRSSHCRFGMASELSGGWKIKSGLYLAFFRRELADFGTGVTHLTWRERKSRLAGSLSFGRGRPILWKSGFGRTTLLKRYLGAAAHDFLPRTSM